MFSFYFHFFWSPHFKNVRPYINKITVLRNVPLFHMQKQRTQKKNNTSPGIFLPLWRSSIRILEDEWKATSAETRKRNVEKCNSVTTQN